MHGLITEALDRDHWKEMVNEFQRPLQSHKGLQIEEEEEDKSCV
jgi:hypothetical protein